MNTSSDEYWNNFTTRIENKTIGLKYKMKFNHLTHNGVLLRKKEKKKEEKS